MGVLSKEQFIAKFWDDQLKYNIGGSKEKFVFTGEQVADIYSSYRGGESLTSIGNRYGCSRKTISRRLFDWGVK